MKIVIVGAGLIGVSCAYFLSRCGHDIIVLDRAAGPGLETSFANGGLLTPSMAEPWNSPGCWRTLLASLGRSDSAMQLRIGALPSLLGWGVQFLWNSRAPAFARSALGNMRLTLYSLRVMESLRREAPIEYGRGAMGALKLFRDRAKLDDAAEAAQRVASEGLHGRTLSAEETIALEPALAPIATRLAGAIHFDADETGDAHRFCTALADHARKRSVEFRFGIGECSLEMRNGAVAAVVSERERFAGDRFIIAAGSYSTPLLRDAGVRLPVRPAKGYSITLDAGVAQPQLRIPLIDDHWHAAIVPLDGVLRVAGTAEFAGYDLAMNADRIRNLSALLRDVLPQADFDASAVRPWCGLRAMSADGMPIIGPTPVSNLLVNTGHGHLGWGMAAGAGQLLADLICERSPGIDPAPYAFSRFG